MNGNGKLYTLVGAVAGGMVLLYDAQQEWKWIKKFFGIK
jgi:hypothetical protein